MKKHSSIIAIFAISLSNLLASSARETIVLENDWKFLLSDAKDAKEQSFDDSAWENVTVPHDGAIDKPFDMTIDSQYVTVTQDGEVKPNIRTGRTGALPCFGKAWYRKVLDIPTSKKDKRIFLEFDGAMSNAKIYINGDFVGHWSYGYTSFCLDITKFVKFGEDNLLAVGLDNELESSRWYTGIGLYRNVRLVYKNDTHINYNGIYITTPEISKKSALVKSKIEIVNQSPNDYVIQEVYDAKNNIVASKKSTNLKNIENIEVHNPNLWSIESPYLYTVKSKIFDENDRILDECDTRIGFRTISFSKENGFELNGERVYIKGVCVHHDLGALGAQTNVSAIRRNLKLFKEMGCNSIRMSHNPASEEFLDLCDELGFIVQAESFDEWNYAKCRNGYHTKFQQWAQKDLTALIRRDRNHPSIIMWCVGNEILEQGKPDGYKTARFLVDIVRKEDPTRPTTAGLDSMYNATHIGKIAQEIDLVGFNYRPHMFEPISKEFPDMIYYGSEMAAPMASRGVYYFPAVEHKNANHFDYQSSAYGYEYPNCGNTIDETFDYFDKFPNFFGLYIWTGIDYLGEPTPYNPITPARSSYFGVIDLAGFPKDTYYLYQSHWNTKDKVLHVLPHWNWHDRLNQNVPVHCFTNYDKVQLFVNGKSMGIKSKDKSATELFDRYRIRWDDVIYQPGEIKVVAYDKDGTKREEKTIKTASDPYTVSIKSDKSFKNDSKELIFLEIDVIDKDGNFCPRANQFMFVEVTGAGKLKALCNGDATEQTSFSSTYMKSFNGKLLAIIQPNGQKGDISIKIRGMKLVPKYFTLKSK